jgi:seryl-tRNA synthetase
MKKKLNQDDMKKYTALDDECGRLHKLIRAEKDKTRLIGYFDELIRAYDRMSSMIRPSWMERIAIKQLVKTREALKKSIHQIKPQDSPTDEELEIIVNDKDKLRSTLKGGVL